MSECADRDKVDTAFGIVANGVERDAAAGLGLILAADHGDSLTGIVDREVVKHDAVHAAVGHHLADFVERAYFYFNLQV